MFSHINNVQSYKLCSVILTMFSHINSVQSCINEMKFLPWPFLGVHWEPRCASGCCRPWSGRTPRHETCLKGFYVSITINHVGRTPRHKTCLKGFVRKYHHVVGTPRHETCLKVFFYISTTTMWEEYAAWLEVYELPTRAGVYIQMGFNLL